MRFLFLLFLRGHIMLVQTACQSAQVWHAQTNALCPHSADPMNNLCLQVFVLKLKSFTSTVTVFQAGRWDKVKQNKREFFSKEAEKMLQKLLRQIPSSEHSERWRTQVYDAGGLRGDHSPESEPGRRVSQGFYGLCLPGPSLASWTGVTSGKVVDAETNLQKQMHGRGLVGAVGQTLLSHHGWGLSFLHFIGTFSPTKHVSRQYFYLQMRVVPVFLPGSSQHSPDSPFTRNTQLQDNFSQAPCLPLLSTQSELKMSSGEPSFLGGSEKKQCLQ